MGIVNRIAGTLAKVPKAVSYFLTRSSTIDNSRNNGSLVSNSVNGPVPISVSLTGGIACSSESTFKEKLAKLWKISEDFQVLQSTKYVLDCDMYTNMPSKSKEFRSWQLKSLDEIIHEKLSSDEISLVIEYFLKEENYNRLNDVEKALLGEVQRENYRVKNVPLALIQELNDATTKAYGIWVRARELSDFDMFAPELDKIISIKKQIAECIGYEDSPYDVFLDEYEPGLTASELDKIHAELKNKLIPMLKKIDEQQIEFKKDCLFIDMDPREQLEFGIQFLKDIGYDLSRSRLDLAKYPFSHGIAPNDVRLTVSVKDNIFNLIGCLLHEQGHGRYDMGISPDLAKTPLYDAPSLSMHESQSNMYERIVGPSMPFLRFYFPKLKERLPEQFANVSLDDFYKAINDVGPPNLRSDDGDSELTYVLEVLIYSELERALIEGKIAAKDVPALSRKMSKDYLGVKNNDHCAPGVLNHDHWTTGEIGYFPTYLIGMLYGAQIYAACKKVNPNLEEQIAKGDFSKLDSWLTENIYKYGKIKPAHELLKLATGEDLNIDYFIDYIKEKYSKIYNIAL